MTNTEIQTRCPVCGSDTFGAGDNTPVTVDGWYGNRHFSWGRYAGVHTVKCDSERCGDCNHAHSIKIEWDE